MFRAVVAAIALVLVTACRTAGPAPAKPLYDIEPWVARAHQILQRGDVQRAFDSVDGARDAIVAEWRTLTEIPAPSGHETKRADFIEPLLRDAGLTIERDQAGNVIATRKGTGGGRHVVFDAHLDTVFPLTTDLTTRIENGRIYAPGVGDDTRNIVAMLAMIRAMNAGGVDTRGDVTFLFSVEEETTFRGIKQFIADRGATVDRFVALDGGYGGFTYGGIGIYWDRYHVTGRGGHTRSATPPYSATLPIARAIDRIYELPVSRRTWINVGMLGGADVFNAKAADAWMSVDLRSTDSATLHRLDAEIESIVRDEATKLGMQMRREVVSKSEVAKIAGHRTSEMVLATEGVWRAFGFDPPITDTASNHSSAVLLAGIPAISTGSTPCGGAHSLAENCAIEPIFTGIKRNIALAVALAE